MFVADRILKRLGIRDYEETPKIGGVASGKVCSGKQYKSKSIVERGSGTSIIHVFLHEVGHNLGIKHQNWWSKTIGENVCDVDKSIFQGIIRGYEDWVIKKPYKWTACNRCDLLSTYQKIMEEHGEYCLDKTNLS